MANNLMRFDPFSDIARFEPFRNIDELFRDFAMMPSMRGAESLQRIKMDISETEQEYLVKADIPGVQKEDIKVAIEGNRVSVSAEIKEEKESGGAGILRSERFYGQQSRSFILPQEVDDQMAQAKYENGVLALTLPKKAGSTSKQLQVQ
ncbi:MAG: Hsp20/alpha crystallin family protein [Pseudomonadota bacterium]